MIRIGVALVVVACLLFPSVVRADPADDEADNFGLWDSSDEPYMFAVVGLMMRRLPRSGDRLVSARTTGDGAGGTADTSLDYVQGLRVALTRPLFVGFDAEIGLAERRGVDPIARQILVGAVSVLGVRASAGSIVLGAELAAGGRVIESDRGKRHNGEAVVEARIQADLWVTPWFTIGGTVGTSLIDRGDRMIGLNLGFHTNAFGGNTNGFAANDQ